MHCLRARSQNLGVRSVSKNEENIQAAAVQILTDTARLLGISQFFRDKIPVSVRQPKITRSHDLLIWTIE